MKTLKYFLFISFAAQLLYAQSSIVIGTGASIDVGLGADICAGSITGTLTGDGTQCGAAIPKVLNLVALIEGFYNGISMVPDTVMIEFRNSVSPYTLVEQNKLFLNSSGAGTGSLTDVLNGTSYYLVIQHRNSIETWSKTGKSFTSNLLSYDFTTAAAQAYGDNIKLKNGKWCIYSGDVDQDGSVDLTDMIEVDNDNANFVTGYVPSDVNGDLLSDLSDMIIVDNNNAAFVGKVVPPGAITSKKIELRKQQSYNHLE